MVFEGVGSVGNLSTITSLFSSRAVMAKSNKSDRCLPEVVSSGSPKCVAVFVH